MDSSSPLLLFGVAMAMAFAGCVQGFLGFGFGLVSMGLLPFLLGVKGAVPLVGIVALVLNINLLVRFRRHFQWRSALPLLGGATLGIPVGVLALTSWSSSWLMIALGGIVVTYVAWSLLGRTAPRPLGRGAGWALGVASGVLGGAFGTSGPPAVAWVSSQDWSSQTMRATLVGLFTLAGVLQVALLTERGLVTLATVGIGAVGLPAAMLGGALGARLGDRIPQAQFRRFMLAGLGVLGFVFIVNGVRGE